MSTLESQHSPETLHPDYQAFFEGLIAHDAAGIVVATQAAENLEKDGAWLAQHMHTETANLATDGNEGIDLAESVQNPIRTGLASYAFTMGKFINVNLIRQLQDRLELPSFFVPEAMSEHGVARVKLPSGEPLPGSVKRQLELHAMQAMQVVEPNRNRQIVINNLESRIHQ